MAPETASKTLAFGLTSLSAIGEFLQIPGAGVLVGFAVACLALGYMQKSFCSVCQHKKE